MLEKGTEQAGCLLLIFEGVVDFVVEMLNVVRNKVGPVGGLFWLLCGVWTRLVSHSCREFGHWCHVLVLLCPHGY